MCCQQEALYVRLVASIFDATALHVRKLRSCLLGLGLAVARHVSDTSRLSAQLVTARWCGGKRRQVPLSITELKGCFYEHSG